jgi:hypothetical protein
MPQENPRQDFDQEIAKMVTLATALMGDLPRTAYVYPAPPVSTLPGVSIVRSELEGERNADPREDSR